MQARALCSLTNRQSYETLGKKIAFYRHSFTIITGQEVNSLQRAETGLSIKKFNEMSFTLLIDENKIILDNIIWYVEVNSP